MQNTISIAARMVLVIANLSQNAMKAIAMVRAVVSSIASMANGRKLRFPADLVMSVARGIVSMIPATARLVARAVQPAILRIRIAWKQAW